MKKKEITRRFGQHIFQDKAALVLTGCLLKINTSQRRKVFLNF